MIHPQTIKVKKFYKVEPQLTLPTAVRLVVEWRQRHPERNYEIQINHRSGRGDVVEVVDYEVEVGALPDIPQAPDCEKSYRHPVWAEYRKNKSRWDELAAAETKHSPVYSQIREKMPRG